MLGMDGRILPSIKRGGMEKQSEFEVDGRREGARDGWKEGRC